MSLNIETTPLESGRVVVTTIGRLDAYEAPTLAGELEGLLEDGKTDLALDLSQTVFIDSTALAEIVRAMKKARQSDGDLVLLDPSEAVTIILELTAFDRAFAIERSEVGAGATDGAGSN